MNSAQLGLMLSLFQWLLDNSNIIALFTCTFHTFFRVIWSLYVFKFSAICCTLHKRVDFINYYACECLSVVPLRADEFSCLSGRYCFTHEIACIKYVTAIAFLLNRELIYFSSIYSKWKTEELFCFKHLKDIVLQDFPFSLNEFINKTLPYQECVTNRLLEITITINTIRFANGVTVLVIQISF